MEDEDFGFTKRNDNILKNTDDYDAKKNDEGGNPSNTKVRFPRKVFSEIVRKILLENVRIIYYTKRIEGLRLKEGKEKFLKFVRQERRLADIGW